MLGQRARSRFVRSVNMALVIVIGGLAVMFGQSLVEHYWLKEELSGTRQSEVQQKAQGERTEQPSRSYRSLPDLGQFQIVVDRDPFRVLLENVVSTSVKAVPPPPSIPKPPLPPLTITLSGTIAIGDDRKAILKDGTQEDVYSVGQVVAGGVLAAVEYDRVVIARGGEQTKLLLQSAMAGDSPMIAGRPSQGLVSAAGDKKNNKAAAVGKPLFATPAFARYPGVGTQSKGDHER